MEHLKELYLEIRKAQAVQMELIRVIRKGFDFYATEASEGSKCIVIEDLNLNLGVGICYPAPKSETSNIYSGYGICASHPRIQGALYSLFAYPDCITNDVVLVEDMGPDLVSTRISLTALGAEGTIKQLQKCVESFILRVALALSPIDW